MELFNSFKRICVFLIVLFTSNIAIASELILSAPPRESVAEGNKLYEPIATYLSSVLGRKVTYKHSKNWFKYQMDMRNDKYDIIFDGPHFISWRLKHLKHEVLVKLPGELDFMLVADASNSNLKKSKDLTGKYFCGISPPNLSSLSFLASFSNPVIQPRVKGIKGGMGKVFQAFENKKCTAAMLRGSYYKTQLSEHKRKQLKVLFRSSTLPNQAITASSRLSLKEKRKISKGLLSADGVEVLQGIVDRFAEVNASSFTKTNNAEYKGYNKYLEGVLIGW